MGLGRKKPSVVIFWRNPQFSPLKPVALTKHFWGLKNKGLTPEIQWSILKRSNTPKCFNSRCNLCLEEKMHILLYQEAEKLLNKRCELIARCRHRAKFKL